MRACDGHGQPSPRGRGRRPEAAIPGRRLGPNPAIPPARRRARERDRRASGHPARSTRRSQTMSHHTAAAPAHGATHHHAPHAADAHEPHQEEQSRKPWTVLALMLMAQFMVILDVSVVNVALPTVGRSLSFSSGDYQWVVSAYVLLSGGLLLFGGRLADLFDRRTMFLTGLGLFTTASLVSATASSAATMIVSRGAQGTGAALLTPAALSIIVTTYTGKQRSTALAIWGTIGSMGIAAGVLLGGILTTTLGWRSIFFVNVPIGIVAAVLTLRTVARNRNN